MKLNNKRTILVGLAFLSICAFWQMYDSVMTLILTDTFHLNETIAGAVMAADNVLALFLLPLFGAVSDKCKSRRHDDAGERLRHAEFVREYLGYNGVVGLPEGADKEKGEADEDGALII